MNIGLELSVMIRKFTTPVIISLDGDMGSGKTVLCKGICKGLGSNDLVTSPTFNIINLYDSPYGCICHVDLYRVDNIAGILPEITGNVILVEWCKIDTIKPHLLINIKYGKKKNDRIISIWVA